MVLDLNLPTSEFICFEGDSVSFIDKKSMRDSVVLNQGAFVKTSQEVPASVFDRTRKNALLGRLNKNGLERIDANSSPEPTKSRYGEECRSVRSQARSLSIAPNSTTKVQPLRTSLNGTVQPEIASP